MELIVGLLGLVLGAAVGAVVERSRSRAGYLAKQYRDHLMRLFQLVRFSTDSREAEPEALEKHRQTVLDARSAVEADVWLFGTPLARARLRNVHQMVAANRDEPLDEATVDELAKILRGRFDRFPLLAPQKRWFRN